MDVPVKVAVVTGAGSGIGRAVARGLLADGFSVVLAGRRREALDIVVDKDGPDSLRTIAVPTDVTDDASVQALFATARERFGRVDLLFNNAGISGPGLPLDQVSPAQWREVIDVNVTGVFLCTRAAFVVMKAQAPRGGRIINNGSIAAHVPRPHAAPYTASKHAVTGLTRVTSLEGRLFDIACGQIDIGNTATSMASSYAGGVLQANGEVVVEPLFDVSHVARAVSYMASLPLDANVQFMTVMATKMPYIGRG